MVGDTAPAHQDQSPTRPPGRGGRAGACLSSQWGGVWTAGGWGCRGPESRVAGGQLLAATPAQRAGAPGSVLVMLALPTGQDQTRVQVSEEQSAAGAARGAGLEKQLLDRVSGAQVYTAHTHARTHCLATWEGRRLSHMHTDLSHTLGSPVWGRAEGPTRRIVGSHSWGWGFPGSQDSVWTPRLPGIPGSMWGAGDPDSPARLAEVRAAVGRLDRWTDGGLDRATCAQQVNK